MLPTKESQITHHKLFHPSFFPSNKNVSLNARDATAKNEKKRDGRDRPGCDSRNSGLGWLEGLYLYQTRGLRRFATKNIWGFLWAFGGWDGEKICRSKIILNILPVKDGCFSNEKRRGEVKKWSLKLTQSLPCEKWREREALYTSLFGDLQNLTIWIILLNILYILARDSFPQGASMPQQNTPGNKNGWKAK